MSECYSITHACQHLDLDDYQTEGIEVFYFCSRIGNYIRINTGEKCIE